MQVYMNLQQEVSPSPQVPFGSLHVCFHQLIPATADRLLQMSTELKILVVAHEGMDLRFSPWCSWSRGVEVYPWCLERERGSGALDSGQGGGWDDVPLVLMLMLMLHSRYVDRERAPSVWGSLEDGEAYFTLWHSHECPGHVWPWNKSWGPRVLEAKLHLLLRSFSIGRKVLN